MSKFNRSPVFSVLLLCLVAGCSNGNVPDVVPVYGTITLNGEPVTGAEVFFQPESGRPSFAETDDYGRYNLMLTQQVRGAIPGKHRVSISTYLEANPDSKNPVVKKGRREQIPGKYNVNSELAVDIDGNSSPVNFDLVSGE